MANGANGVHLQLREALEDYIKSQYFGKSPILLSAVQNKLDQEGILYQKPYIESSPAYKSELNGIQKSSKLPDWVKAYFDALANADLGVYSSPFCHQVEALEAAFAGKDLFVSTGTGSGKTECFMWPLLAKLAAEARNTPANWSMRGVRTIIMYPMNALVSDQVSRLRRLIGDSEHRFVNVFRETCGEDSRRPQFGMYTGRTPYAGKEPKRGADRSLVATYSEMLNAETDEEKAFLQKLIKDGKFPVKEDFHEFLRKLYDSNHIPDDEDAELVTRFEMQRFCPDILITNYSMLEYMLLRPIESKIWADTQNWLNADSNNKLLFVIDEAHMYRGSAGGEVSFLIRRLFHRLGIDRSRVQFILTTASMPNKNEEDRRVIQTFANDLTASDDGHEFHYLAGQQEEIGSGRAYDIPFDRFTKAHPESFEGDNAERLLALNKFWEGIIDSPAPFSTDNSAYQWLYDHLVDYVPFRELFKLCRGTTASLQELAQSIFPGAELEDAFHAVGVMLAIAPLARSGSGSVLFPASTGFSCWVYKNYGKSRCTSHAIGWKTLNQLVLEDIRRNAVEARRSAQDYMEMLVSLHTEKQKAEVDRYKRELKRVDKRIGELSKILNKLYEDAALEKISEERYQAMAPKYEREQAALQGQREELAAEISKSDKVYENIEQFLPLIWKYTGITELTPYILNELIERIVVHEKAVGPDGVKTQQVDIYYKFVGCINQRRNGGCTGEVIKADKAQPGSRPA